MKKQLENRINEIIKEAETTIEQAQKLVYKLHTLKIDINMCECKSKEVVV